MFRMALNYMREFEPARLKAWLTAFLALCAGSGLTISPLIEQRLKLAVGIATVVLTVAHVVLGEVIRAGVYSPGAVKAAVTDAQQSTVLGVTESTQPVVVNIHMSPSGVQVSGSAVVQDDTGGIAPMAPVVRPPAA